MATKEEYEKLKKTAAFWESLEECIVDIEDDIEESERNELAFKQRKY